MKKIKISSSLIIKYVYAIVFLANAAVIFYFYNFLNENVYKSFAIDQEFLSAQVKKSTEGIDSAKFENIKNSLDKKLSDKMISEDAEINLNQITNSDDADNDFQQVMNSLDQ